MDSKGFIYLGQSGQEIRVVYPDQRRFREIARDPYGRAKPIGTFEPTQAEIDEVAAYLRDSLADYRASHAE